MAKQNTIAKTVFLQNISVLAGHKHFFDWLVFLFSFLLFANSILNDYNLDDTLVTIHHRLTTKGISAIPEIFSSPYYQDESGYSYEYRPVVLVSFAIENQIFGENPHISHFLNVLLYALCCLMLFKTLRLLLYQFPVIVPFGISLLFAAHPSHTEVVCSIKNRDEMLGLLFTVLAFYCGIKAVNLKRPSLILATALLYALGLLSKITTISFALIIPLALVLFTQINFLYLTGIALGLAVSSYLLLTFASGVQKAAIATLIVFGAIALYLPFRVKFQWISPRTLIGGILTEIRGSIVSHRRSLPENTVTQGWNYQAILNRLIPDKQIWKIWPILISAILMPAYGVCVAYNHSLLAILPLAFIILASLSNNEAFGWWGDFSTGACISIAISATSLKLVQNITHFTPETLVETFSVYTAYQIAFGRRGLALPMAVFFTFSNALYFHIFRNFDGFILVFTLLLIFRFPWLLIVYVISVQQHYILLFSVLAIFYFKKARWIFPALALLTFGLFHYTEAKYDRDIFVQQKLTTAVSNFQTIANTAAPKIVSITQYRPLMYIEDCVNNHTPFTYRAGTSLEILWHYLQKAVLPYPLSFYYGYKFIYPLKLTATLPLITLVMYSILVFLGFLLLRYDRMMSLGIFTYLFSVVVFSNFSYPVPGMLADRFLFIPSLGWSIGLVALLLKIIKLKGAQTSLTWANLPKPAKYLFTGILLLYTIVSFSRNFEWNTDLKLMRHDINYVSQSAEAHNLLGLHLMEHAQKMPDSPDKTAMEFEALSHFKESKNIYPDFFNVRYDIGRVYLALNMPDSAITAFKYALLLDTAYDNLYLNLGGLLAQKGRLQEAVPYFTKLIEIRPNDNVGYQQLVNIYFNLKQFDNVIKTDHIAIQKFNNIPDFYINLGQTYLTLNEVDSARFYLKKADTIAPGNRALQQIIRQIDKQN